MKYFKKIYKHYRDIKKFGISEFFRKTKILAFLILNNLLIIFFVLPSFLIFFLISKFIVFRFGIIRSSRVGHFIANTELYLLEKKFLINDSKIVFDFIAFDNVNISNAYLSKHYKKIIKIYPNIFVQPFCDFINYFKNNNYIKKSYIKILGGGGDRDINGYIYKGESSFNFNNKEDEKIIKDTLEKLEFEKDTKFICLTVRDNSYLKKLYPRHNWNYHDYRNWDIKKFVKASESLAKRGYKVIRMGKEVKDTLESPNPMIIDYANSPYRSDIMDIYLHSKSFFTATTGTGIDTASYVSRVPMAWISVPVQSFYSFKNNFHATKHHKSRQSGVKLTLSKIFEYGSPTDQKFIDNVLIEELSESEIDDFLNEVLDNLENKSQFSEQDKELNMKFWENYKILAKKYKIDHLHKNYESIFSPNFLKKNPQLLK